MVYWFTGPYTSILVYQFKGIKARQVDLTFHSSNDTDKRRHLEKDSTKRKSKSSTNRKSKCSTMTIEEVLIKKKELKRLHVFVEAKLGDQKYLIKDATGSATLSTDQKVKVKMDLVIVKPRLVGENEISCKYPPSVRKPSIMIDQDNGEGQTEDKVFGKSLRIINKIIVYITGFFKDPNSNKAFTCRDQGGNKALVYLHEHMGQDFNLPKRGFYTLINMEIFLIKSDIIFMSARKGTQITSCNSEDFEDVQLGDCMTKASLLEYTNFAQFSGGSRFTVDLVFSIGEENDDVLIKCDQELFSFSAGGDCDVEDELDKLRDSMFIVQYDVSQNGKNYCVKLTKCAN